VCTSSKMASLNSFGLLCFMVLAMLLNGQSDALHCSQCNMRQRGVGNTCAAPRNMSNCIGCMKTLTKVKLRDSGHMNHWERLSVVVSRYCMRPGATKILPEGCYKQQNNGGYTERCFCYSDNCNSGAASLSFGLLPPFVSLPGSLLQALCVSLMAASVSGYVVTWHNN
jgi:hypothetical protein